MYKPADMTVWQGRVDAEETTPPWRWHQKVQAWDRKRPLNNAPTLLGFACDEGVRRNKGRPGARNGPCAIRGALTNLAYHLDGPIFDAGDIDCEDRQLEQAQEVLAEQVSHVLQHQGFPVVLGGGHEVAWGSFLGVTKYFKRTHSSRRIGIINFDAHFDLRNPQPQPSSGTPFRQIAHWCDDNSLPFNYLVFGINPSTNTQALFEFAKKHQVVWHSDVQCTVNHLPELIDSLSRFMQQIDCLYLTICLDAFPASVAPGVSAPCAIGVEPVTVIHLIHKIKVLCKQNDVMLIITDIAEMNPEYDRDGSTAKLAARLVYEFVSTPV
jgi:formiminoglutamase